MPELNPGTTPIRAILFDLHHTITKTRVDMVTLTREAAESVGIQESRLMDEGISDSKRSRYSLGW